ncbi:intracellular hyaluronan-binding protein 4-like [Synchiropus splendidus]|uniref:intracellular hyaluronan-binding protein 4-like n=1 Tax=Synchiropus splendidus TaxID=270530 RepID=UPI00237D3C15|nr:intracellular hyaluronan-binding protein 4-like [Synchiropus splendidus]
MLPDSYGCAIANRFGDLLDDDADPFDLINVVEAEKEKKAKKKKEDADKKVKPKKLGQRESQKERRVPLATGVSEPAPAHKQLVRPVLESGERKEEPLKGKRNAPFGERRFNQEQRPQEFSASRSSYDQDPEFRGRGGSRGRRGGRGGTARNNDNYTLRGKREYDRHNGTGISPDEKRGGRGAWNWGSVEDPAGEEMDVGTDAPPKPEEPQVAAEDDNQNLAPEDGEGEMVVQVAVEMSLDEWKSLQEASRSKADFNIRKTENQIPSKAKVIHESKHVEILKETLENLEDEGTFLRRSVNDITSLLDINFGSLGRPGRGGRGRGARGASTGVPIKPKAVQEKMLDLAPDPDNPEDFPALSAGK